MQHCFVGNMPIPGRRPEAEGAPDVPDTPEMEGAIGGTGNCTPDLEVIH